VKDDDDFQANLLRNDEPLFTIHDEAIPISEVTVVPEAEEQETKQEVTLSSLLTEAWPKLKLGSQQVLRSFEYLCRERQCEDDTFSHLAKCLSADPQAQELFSGIQKLLGFEELTASIAHCLFLLFKNQNPQFSIPQSLRSNLQTAGQAPEIHLLSEGLSTLRGKSRAVLRYIYIM